MFIILLDSENYKLLKRHQVVKFKNDTLICYLGGGDFTITEVVLIFSILTE